MFKRSAESIFNYLSFVLLSLSIITSSFDICLQVKISSFNIRFSVVCMILLNLVFMFKLITQKNTSIKLIAPVSATIWILFLIVFIPNTHFLARNILYMVWLMIYIWLIISVGQFSTKREYFFKIIKVYVYSNALISMIGVLQFFLFYLGINFFLGQAFSPNFPRISGFSYEPSYYATFLVTGFVTNLYLLNHKSAYFNYKFLVVNQILIFIAIFMSTSKLVIPTILVIIALTSIFDVFNRLLTRFTIYIKDIISISLLMVALLVPIYYLIFDFDKVRFLFNGLGIAGTVSHSVTIRERDFEHTVQAFTNSPLVGYSLGGVPSAIGEIRGVFVTNNELAKENEGMNIFMETLAGSGVLGFLFFLFFVFSFLFKPLSIAKRLEKNGIEPELAIILRALFWGGLVLLFILNFNQNILRPFLWMHFAIMNLAYFFAKNKLKEKLL